MADHSENHSSDTVLFSDRQVLVQSITKAMHLAKKMSLILCTLKAHEHLALEAKPCSSLEQMLV